MKLAIFDLDHTILDIDSDHNWGQYIADNNLCDADYEARNNAYYQQYQAGGIAPVEFTEFVASFLAQHSLDVLQRWLEDYIQTRVVQHIRPKALARINYHRKHGHTVVISSATNDFIVAAIARECGVPSTHIIASQLEKTSTGYTGKIGGLPNFTTGKVTNLQAWLDGKPAPTETWAYSDSCNDIPLLEFADYAYAISADETLNAHAHQQGWKIEDWSL